MEKSKAQIQYEEIKREWIVEEAIIPDYDFDWYKTIITHFRKIEGNNTSRELCISIYCEREGVFAILNRFNESSLGYEWTIHASKFYRSIVDSYNILRKDKDEIYLGMRKAGK